MQDLVIILPTHNRHDYLGSKISTMQTVVMRYISVTPLLTSLSITNRCQSYFLSMDARLWILRKSLSTLNKVYSKLVILTPDDDFLDMDTLNECKSKMLADGNISLSVGVQVCFNEPYDGKWYIQPTANLLRGYDLSQDKMENAQIFGSHYQNVLWSLFRQDVICEAFKKLKRNNPKNGNFIEMTWHVRLL